MKLEVGKRYVTRDGRKIDPLRLRDSTVYTFEADLEDGSGCHSWTKDGRFYTHDIDSQLDLVAEYAGYVGPAKEKFLATSYEYDPSNRVKRPTYQSLTLDEHTMEKTDLDTQTEPTLKPGMWVAYNGKKFWFVGLLANPKIALIEEPERFMPSFTAMVSVSELNPWKESEETPARNAFKEWASHNFVGGNQFHIFQAGWEAAKNDQS